MDIKPNDLVLEIGSGNNPHPRADILCDRYLTKNIERAGAFSIVVDRPFVVCDGCRLPFADQSFDYIICSHILEHMERPAAFLNEVMRVGKAGYIEVPSALSERLFGWNFHRWYCTWRGRRLVMVPKTEGERFGGFFHRLIAQNIWFRRFFEKYEKMFYVRFEWRRRVPFIIEHKPMGHRTLATLDANAYSLLKRAYPESRKDALFYIAWIKRRIKRKIRKELRRVRWRFREQFDRSGIISDLERILVCVSCGSAVVLNKHHDTLVCKACKIMYPIRGSMPIMLTAHEKTKGY